MSTAPEAISVSGLDGVCKLIRTELEKVGTTIMVQAKSYKSVEVMTTYLPDFSRNILYRAEADAPGLYTGFRGREVAMIELRSLFIPNEGTAYLLDLLARMTDEKSVSTNDNGVKQTEERQRRELRSENIDEQARRYGLERQPGESDLELKKRIALPQAGRKEGWEQMMDERERRDIMLRAIHRYGEAAQIDMAVEEMAELTKALCKVKRATPGATTTAAIANVIEEIADVQIMLDQLRLIFARSTEEVEGGQAAPAARTAQQLRRVQPPRLAEQAARVRDLVPHGRLRGSAPRRRCPE